MKLVNIGFGGMVAEDRILAVLSPDSSPIKRIVQDVRERGQLVDASYGRKTQSVLVMDSGHVILSALPPETVASRVSGNSEQAGEGTDE